jgi:hypothetical protein
MQRGALEDRFRLDIVRVCPPAPRLGPAVERLGIVLSRLDGAGWNLDPVAAVGTRGYGMRIAVLAEEG